MVAEALVGRVAELAALRARLAGKEGRIVTVWGPGGIGKTRLALEVVRDLPGATFFCPLAHARSAKDLVKVVGQSLGLSGNVARTDTDALARIGRALASRGASLVVLDNVEQILTPAVAALSLWTALAKEARFLVTSREVTRAPGEVAFELLPLALPRTDEEDADAVRLLVTRARAVRPGFSAEGRVLRAIVERLDGIPLAIELAAARLAVLRADQLEARLAKRFDVLAVAHGGLEPRQRTLRGAIDWSWDLLDEDERGALAALSVFRGTFDLEAVEAVLEGPLGARATELLTTLRHKSLVRAAPEADAGTESVGPRFVLLESIRDYASERLEAREEARAIEDRHAAYFAREGERAAEALDSDGGEAALLWLGREQDNLLAVVERFLASPSASRAEGALRAAAALEPLLAAWGPLSLAADVLERALAVPDASAAPAAARARALEAHAEALLGVGQLAEAHEAAVASRAVDPHADGASRARRTSLLGAIEQARGATAEARALQSEALSIAEAAGARREIGYALSSLALVDHVAVAPERAEALYRQAIDVLAAAGSTRLAARAEARLGFLMVDLGRFAEARALFESSLAKARGKNRALEGIVTGYLGNALRAEGRLREADAYYTDALQRVSAAGDRRFEATFTMDLGILRALEGRFAAALVLLASAESLGKEVGDPRLAALARGYRAMALAGATEIEAARALLDPPTDAVVERVQAYQAIFIEACALRGRSDVEAATARLRGEIARRASAGLFTDHERLTARAAEATLDGLAPPEAALVVDAARGRIRLPGGVWVELPPSTANGRAFRALLERRATAPGVAVSVDEIVAQAWPGERLRAEAAKNRVRVAIAALRSLGLREVLLSRDAGYVLDPAVVLVRTSI